MNQARSTISRARPLLVTVGGEFAIQTMALSFLFGPFFVTEEIILHRKCLRLRLLYT